MTAAPQPQNEGVTGSGDDSGLPGVLEDLAMARRTGELSGFLYERLLISIIPRVRGQVALRLFRLIYKDLAVGGHSRCWGAMSVVMARNSSIVIGRDFSAVSDRRRAGIALYSPCKLRTLPGAHIRIGDRVGLNGTSITSRGRIEIGDGTIVAANVIIVDADFHQQWPPEARLRPDTGQPVTIGQDVWIGMGTMVLKGSAIGDHSIIGAGSVVTGAIPANVIAAGNPARVVRPIGPNPVD